MSEQFSESATTAYSGDQIDTTEPIEDVDTVDWDDSLNAEDISNNIELMIPTEIANLSTRTAQLQLNSTLVAFDTEGNPIELTEGEQKLIKQLKVNQNVKLSETIVKSQTHKLRPVPDTILGDEVKIITPAINLDNTNQVLITQKEDVILPEEKSEQRLLETSLSTVPLSSILTTDSTTTLAIDAEQYGLYGVQREAQTRVNPYAKPKIICRYLTAKGTECQRAPMKGCKRCAQHKKHEDEEVEDEEDELEEILEEEIDAETMAEIDQDLAELDQAAEDYEPESETDSEDMEDDEMDSELPKNKKPRAKVYKRHYTVVPKTMKVEKFRQIANTFALEPPKILAIQTRTYQPKLPSLIPTEAKLDKVPLENDQIYAYRNKYTQLAFQLGGGSISWDNCIVLGKMKINKIMYGVSYDPDMESLLLQVDQQMG